MRFSVGKRTAEYLIYLLFWGMLLLSPFFGAILNGGNLSFNTENLFSFWLFLLPAAVLFVLNNNLLMPFLLYKKRGRLFGGQPTVSVTYIKLRFIWEHK